MAGKFKLELSNMKRDNYVFFCPDTPIHLNLCQPIGYVDGLTSSILRGIRGQTIIDHDNLVGSVENVTPVIENFKHVVNNDKKEVTLTYKVINEYDQALTHSITLNSKKSNITPNGDNEGFTYKVTGLIVGNNTLTLHVSDGFETVSTQEIAINIPKPNVAPQIQELTHQLNNDAKECTLTYKVIDDKAQTITHYVTLNGTKNKITPSLQSDKYSHTVTGLVVGNNTIKLHVSDGSLTTDSQDISVEVTEVNVPSEVEPTKKTRSKKKKEVTE